MRGTPAVPDADRRRQRELVEAFLAASREGDLAALVACLDPDVVLRGDELAAKMGGTAELVGATAVAERFKGQTRAAVPGLIDGEVGVLVEIKGRMLLVLQIAFADDGRIAAIDAVANRDSLGRLVLERFGEARSSLYALVIPHWRVDLAE